MADIFLSYASEDRQRVRPLAEALETRGFSVWWDRALGAGEDYAAVITRELAAAKAVVVVWTQASAHSTFVRDEAGRARDQGRLVPVLLDRVEIPLGFGAFQAEDFTNWNGRPEAAQLQLLEEALRAKLEGRSIDGGAVQAKRRRLMTRIRVVSVLTVLALVAGIAASVNTIVRRPEPVVQQQDRGAMLLDLLNQGKLTPEQAIELARLLEVDALGEASAATDAPAAAPAPSDAAESRTMQAEAPAAEAQVASVSENEFESAARQTYREAVQELLTHPDQQVRLATAQLSNPQTRDAAMQTLWDYAQRDGTSAAAIYRICGAVGEANNHPLGLRALERARDLNPQDAQVWRMVSYGLRRNNRAGAAEGAALVGAGLTAQAQGQPAVAQQRLEAALARTEAPQTRAFIEGALGDAAAARNDWSGAAQRYEHAYELRAQAAPDTPAAAAVAVDAQKLVRALDRDGRTEEACRQARTAAQEHDVAIADEALAQRCARLRAPIRLQTQTAPVQQRVIQRDLQVRQPAGAGN